MVHNLHTNINEERMREMNKYGRDALYAKISLLLPDDFRTGFDIVNISLANIDDLIDESDNETILPEAMELLRQGFEGGELTKQTEGWKRDVQMLAGVLGKLKKSHPILSHAIYEEAIRFWSADVRNRKRRGLILNREKLDKLNGELGETVAAQFLYFCCPNISPKDITELARTVGLALKTADNLSDLEPDLGVDYINISEEDMGQYGLKINKQDKNVVISGNLEAYKAKELERIEKLYALVGEGFTILLSQYKEYRTELKLLEEIFYTWLTQAEESITRKEGQNQT